MTSDQMVAVRITSIGRTTSKGIKNVRCACGSKMTADERLHVGECNDCYGWDLFTEEIENRCPCGCDSCDGTCESGLRDSGTWDSDQGHELEPELVQEQEQIEFIGAPED